VAIASRRGTATQPVNGGFYRVASDPMLGASRFCRRMFLSAAGAAGACVLLPSHQSAGATPGQTPAWLASEDPPFRLVRRSAISPSWHRTLWLGLDPANTALTSSLSEPDIGSRSEVDYSRDAIGSDNRSFRIQRVGLAPASLGLDRGNRLIGISGQFGLVRLSPGGRAD
jgi:hypothetical protein